MWRRSTPLLFAFAVTAFASNVRAVTVPPSLEVVRAPGAEACPDAAWVMTRIQNEGSWRPAERGKGDVKLTFFRSNNRYYARIEVPKASSERTLASNADECSELSESTVLALSMLSDDADALWAKKPPPAPPPPPPKPPDPRPGFRPTLELGGVAAFFMLRPAAFGAQLRLGLTHGRSPFSAALGGTFLPSSEIAVGAGSIAVRGLSASLEGCVDAVRHEGTGMSYLYACVHAEGGALHAEGRGFTSSSDASRPWAALGAALRGRLPLVGPLRLVGGVVLQAPLAKEQFQINGVGIAYDPPPVTLFTTIGLEVTFP